MNIPLFLSFYGVVVAIYLSIKFYLSWKNPTYTKPYETSIAVVIPVYHEEPQNLKRCIESVLRNRPDEVYVILDDPDLELEMTAKRYPVNVFVQEHKGKREAQSIAFHRIKSEITVTVDSDTVLEERSIREIVKPFSNPKVGAVCGSLRVLNEKRNVLTRLLAVRYYNACNLDRAAQSAYGIVTCCSGVFSAYRTSIIKKVLDQYMNQRWMGRKCTFGDDRHLTSLVLKEGYDAVFQKTAIAKTLAPESLMKWLKQQLRWNRSFWRENFLMFKWMFRRSKVLGVWVITDTLLPFVFLSCGVIPLIITLLRMGVFQFFMYAIAISVMALLRSAKYSKSSLSYYLMPIYAFLYSLLLLPIYIYAMITTHKTSWMTR